MNPEELRKLIADEIGKVVKAEVAEALKPIEVAITEVKIEQTRLNAIFEMHIAHTAERKADAEKAKAQQKAETAERWKIAAILSAIGLSVISLLNPIFGWFGKHGN